MFTTWWGPLAPRARDPASTCSGYTRLGLGRLSPQGGGGPGLPPVTGLAEACCREGGLGRGWGWGGQGLPVASDIWSLHPSPLPSFLPKVSSGGLGPGKNSGNKKHSVAGRTEERERDSRGWRALGGRSPEKRGSDLFRSRRVKRSQGDLRQPVLRQSRGRQIR